MLKVMPFSWQFMSYENGPPAVPFGSMTKHPWVPKSVPMVAWMEDLLLVASRVVLLQVPDLPYDLKVSQSQHASPGAGAVKVAICVC